MINDTMKNLIDDGLLGWVLGQLIPYLAAIVMKKEFNGTVKAVIVAVLSVIAALIQVYSTKQLANINIETIGVIFVAILVGSQQHYVMFTKTIKAVEQKINLW